MADLQGWSRGTWGEGEFGEFIPVSVTGEQSNTSVGTLTITADAVVTPTGVSSGAVLGTALGEAESIYPLTGVQSNTATGTLEAQEGHGVQPTGVEVSFNDLGFIYNLDSETAGFPVLSNTESITGTTSAYFGSTNNEIQIPQSQDVIQSALSANNQFTIEFWYYIETATFAPRFISVQKTGGASDRQLSIVEFQGQIYVENQQGTRIQAGSVSDQTWTHIAVTADNGTLKLYIDGVLEGTSTGTTFIDAQSEFNIGGTGPFESDDTRFHLDGYMDLFRVSNNVRYTTTFTPPTTAFSVDSNTVVLFNFDGPDGSQDFELLSGTNPAPNIITSTDAGWGRSTWGSFAWGENITIFANLVGQELSTNIGTPTIITGTGETVQPTTVLATTVTGTLNMTGDALVTPTGVSSAIVLQNPTILADGNVTTSAPGDQMDFAIGAINIDIFTQVDATAVTSTFNTGTLAMTGDSNLTLTGEEIVSNTGTVVITAASDVPVTGEQVATEIGVIATQTDNIIPVTGFGLQVQDGAPTIVANATVLPTGVSMAFADGTATAIGSAIVTPTGIEMSVVLGNMRSTPWANVVTGASNTWTEVAA